MPTGTIITIVGIVLAFFVFAVSLAWPISTHGMLARRAQRIFASLNNLLARARHLRGLMNNPARGDFRAQVKNTINRGRFSFGKLTPQLLLFLIPSARSRVGGFFRLQLALFGFVQIPLDNQHPITLRRFASTVYSVLIIFK